MAGGRGGEGTRSLSRVGLDLYGRTAVQVRPSESRVASRDVFLFRRAELFFGYETKKKRNETKRKKLQKQVKL